MHTRHTTTLHTAQSCTGLPADATRGPRVALDGAFITTAFAHSCEYKLTLVVSRLDPLYNTRPSTRPCPVVTRPVAVSAVSGTELQLAASAGAGERHIDPRVFHSQGPLSR